MQISSHIMGNDIFWILGDMFYFVCTSFAAWGPGYFIHGFILYSLHAVTCSF